MIEFRDSRGTHQRIASAIKSNLRIHGKGKSITVLHHPTNPAQIEIRSFFGLWVFPLGFWTLGALLLAAGLGVWH